MNHRGIILLLFPVTSIVLSISHPIPAATLPTTISAYQQYRATHDALERLLFAQDAIRQSSNSEILGSAALDVVRYSINHTENRQSLNVIETALQRLPDDCEGYRELTLAQGKFLARLGNPEEAESIFLHAIHQQWINAFVQYKESLIEIGKIDQACVVEFLRIAGMHPYGMYRGEDDSLEIFLKMLRIMKYDQPGKSAISSVYAQIEEEQGIQKNDFFCFIARTMCMAEDGSSDKALTVLRKIDTHLTANLHRTPKSPQQGLRVRSHREYLHIPLYIALIAQKEGQFLVAQNAFIEFMNRNKNKNSKIAESAVQLLWGLAYRGEDHQKVDEFALFIIESEWYQDEKIREEIGEEKNAVFFDQLQIGLNWSGLGDRSEIQEIRSMVMEKYPHTLGGNFCRFCYVKNGHWRDKGVAMMNEILQTTQYDIIAVHVRHYLAQLALENGDLQEALRHAEDGFRRLSPYESGWKRNFRTTMENLCMEIRNRINPFSTLSH